MVFIIESTVTYYNVRIRHVRIHPQIHWEVSLQATKGELSENYTTRTLESKTCE